MSCCARRTTSAPPTTSRPQTTPRPTPRQTSIVFEYTGRTAMTVTGSATGRRYRFDTPGARVAIDPTDRASLSTVPNLRLSAGPL